MKLISAFRAMGAAFALVFVGVLASAAPFVNDAPNGPSLGTQNVNPFTLGQAVLFNNGFNFAGATAGGGGTGATTQAGCTNLTFASYNITTPTGAGSSLCLPTAFGGREIFIANSTGQTISIFSSASPFTPGTPDTINGTTGTTAYQGLTSGKNAQCFSPQNGTWFCSSGS